MISWNNPNCFALFSALVLGICTLAFASDKPSCLATSIRNKHVKLELATTPETRERGLMDRDHIGSCDGMAFFFPAPAPQKFWMKNTRIPLDILFVDESQKIVSIEHGIPHSLKPVGPDAKVLSVIELEAGRAQREGIRVGDEVHYEIATWPHHLAR